LRPATGGCDSEQTGHRAASNLRLAGLPGARRAPHRTEGMQMNWDRIEGNWKQVKGAAKEKWGKLTDDQLDVIGGKRERLAGKIQELYGVSKDEAEKQLASWQQTQSGERQR
jgi:uncharacterized protein YjbJ (UPF0337 family)